MATANDLLKIFEKEVGTTESPSGSNCVKYNTWYYGKSVKGSDYPWCMAFMCWGFNEADASEIFYGGNKTASCGILIDYAKKTGRWVTSGYRKGDLVFMEFTGDKKPDHVGYVKKVSGKIVYTIEGNTSFDDKGSQSNGGAVAEKERATSLIVGAYRPKYSSTSASKATSTKAVKVVSTKARQLQDGDSGPAVAVLQAALNELNNAKLTVDGEFGSKTKTAVLNYQKAHKDTCGKADGVCGSKTWESILS